MSNNKGNFKLFTVTYPKQYLRDYETLQPKKELMNLQNRGFKMSKQLFVTFEGGVTDKGYHSTY
jgi:hypothetical protein